METIKLTTDISKMNDIFDKINYDISAIEVGLQTTKLDKQILEIEFKIEQEKLIKLMFQNICNM